MARSQSKSKRPVSNYTESSHLRGDASSLITIRINPAGDEFTVPKNLLTDRFSYFTEMFKDISAGGDQLASLEESEGVLSVQSFKLLLEFLRPGKFTLPHTSVKHDVSALIELARLIDMCKVTGAGKFIANMLRTIIFINSTAGAGREIPYESNTECLTSQHIRSAVHLPTGHPVRSVMAGASVFGWLSEKKLQIRERDF